MLEQANKNILNEMILVAHFCAVLDKTGLTTAKYEGLNNKGAPSSHKPIGGLKIDP